MSVDLKRLSTEKRNPDTKNLDSMSTLEIVKAMNLEDKKVPEAINEHLEEISLIIEDAVDALKRNGRIIYCGAGTSGRLAVSDASECPPTFGVNDSKVIALIAGGNNAFIKAVEGAEDDKEAAIKDLERLDVNENDIVIGLAASGRTPYVVSALQYAKSRGCKTASIACNKDSEIGKIADKHVDVIVGPEVLTGSTRLKAGTAQKLILNMISTASMVKMGKAYENLMVDVVPTNEKLYRRAESIVMEATGISLEKAKEKLKEANGNTKIAITMILADCNYQEAINKLEKADGHIKEAIKS